MDLWSRLRQGLRRTREHVGQALASVLARPGAPDEGERRRLEEALLLADVGPATAERLIALAEERMRRDRDLGLRAALEQGAAGMLDLPGAPVGPVPGGGGPWVLLLAGVNGSGKTTLAGKLAAHFARQGRRTLLVAADTFRAAAFEQLEAWAARAGVQVVGARAGSDPAAVVHDGLEAAKARGLDVVLVDTAGRLPTPPKPPAQREKGGRRRAWAGPRAAHHRPTRPCG